MARKKRRLRTELRKNRGARARDKGDVTHHGSDSDQLADAPKTERISGKGSLTRKRTVADAEVAEDASGTIILPAIDRSVCQLGRVMRVQGLVNFVRSDKDHRLVRCATRRLLKTLSTDQRHVVAAGDRVWFRPEGDDEGIIERVEPRHGVLSRTSRGRQHVLVANVDQIVMVASAQEPRLKPNLVDRVLVTAERNEIEPLICINKIDLAAGGLLEQEIGVWAQLGYGVIRTSATTGQGIEELRQRLQQRLGDATSP